MAQIKNKLKYPLKEDPVQEDFLIGSDSQNSGKTVNYELRDIIELVKAVIDVSSDSMQFIFSDDSDEVIPPGTDGYFLVNGNVTNPFLVDTLYLSKVAYGGANVEDLINVIFSNKDSFKLKFKRPASTREFAYYNLNTLTDNGSYFTIGVSIFGTAALGSFQDDSAYSLSVDLTELGYVPNLQQVTDSGSVTDNSVEVGSISVTGGTPSQFLKADGSLDSSVYITGSALDDYYDKQEVDVLISQTGDKSFEFTQPSPSDTWTITHNLGKKPSVTSFDHLGNNVEGQVAYTNDNVVTITFNTAFYGTAYLN